MKRALRILVAPNAFKESLTAAEAAHCISAGIRRGLPNARIVELPIADGGDGTLEVVINGTGGRICRSQVLDPLGRKRIAAYGITGNGKTAIIEMSRASGLALVPPSQRNPWVTTSFGTGQLILAALRHKVEEIILAIGGSATVDGGLGALQALGADFRDRRGRAVCFGGQGLLQLQSIQLERLHPALSQTRLLVACDVDNPLVGPRGAAAVFGPQKGATPLMVKRLDHGLARLAKKISELKQVNISSIPGAGAAGGISGSFLGLLGAQLRPGSDLIFKLLKIDQVIRQVDLIITGEGSIDFQTPSGKGPGILAKWAQQLKLPVVALAGSVTNERGFLHRHGFSALFSVVQGPIDLPSAKRQSARLLQEKAEEVARLIQATRSL